MRLTKGEGLMSINNEPGRDAASRESLRQADDKSLWEVIDDIMESVPEEVLSSFPKDGAEQHDHYLYGSPKRASRES
jgi:hypothetical protein